MLGFFVLASDFHDNWYDSQMLGVLFGGLLGLAGGLIPYGLGSCKENKNARKELRVLRTAMSIELEYLIDAITQIEADLEQPQGVGFTTVPLGRLNSDFLGDIRLYGYKRDDSTEFHKHLATAYQDIIHTNSVLNRYAEYLLSQEKPYPSLKMTLVMSLQGVRGSVTTLKEYIDKKLSR